MNKFKDKTAGSVSHLFSDSPSPSSPPQLQLYQGRWYSEGLNSLSSLFSYIIPSASIDDDDKPKSNDHGNVDIKPIGSLPDRWRNQKLQLEDESLDSCKEYTITYVSEDLKKVCEDKKSIWTEFENKQQMISPRGGGGSSSDSDEFHEAGEQLSPVKGSLNLSDESVFINRELFEFLGSSLPNIVKGCQWVLLYSTWKHGISLRTLIRKSTELPAGPSLLITGDREGAIFGAMLECPLIPTPRRKYQGTNQTFVFTSIYGVPRLFRPTGANRYYYMCLNDLLALGGGANFALCLDGDLLNGTSGPCETFGNKCLAHNEEFELKNVELWGFKHAYRNTLN
ncbi:hypothetical protein ERO13_D09G058900v2 [Gossypium hirsutum]|uniref:Oxidation resistance protein 1 isoform X1 n=1 Tax=Gossypium hirsutum TaxID=3635 RepID=A0A1U8I5J1_GOSHI|nr:oxidation resistance protein 1-like isoform X1 [Gossypium hirsutum]KAG4129128.1 hypothetical protein ERO13_D09G058900v2 [Gossypium hirsutum]